MKTSRGLSLQLSGSVLVQHEQTLGLISSNTKMEINIDKRREDLGIAQVAVWLFLTLRENQGHLCTGYKVDCEITLIFFLGGGILSLAALELDMQTRLLSRAVPPCWHQRCAPSGLTDF